MKKLLITSLIVIIIITLLMGFKSNAFDISSAQLYSIGDYANILRYNNIIIIETAFVVYQKDGIEYPSYCLQNDLQGVNSQLSYAVDVNSLLSDVMVWRAIINGYPYKSYTELGCQNKEEAYIATKQAVYAMIYGRDGSEYSAIGEAGIRTLNALRQIISAARNSTESKVSSDINIQEENQSWTIDDINNNYLSKTFIAKSAAPMNEYDVSVEGTYPEGASIVDINNVPKFKFNNGEKFKIIMPIKNILNSRQV